MAFLILGILLLALKLAEFGAVAAWSWWSVLAPFGLAVLWWGFVDAIGLTQRRAMDKMEQTKVDRRNRNLDALGLGTRRDPKARQVNPFAAAGADAVRRAVKDPVAAAADEASRC
jgi:small Trp-rich protein